jgi:hypothetical protein
LTMCVFPEGDDSGPASNDSNGLSNGRGSVLTQAGPDELPPPYPSMTGRSTFLLSLPVPSSPRLDLMSCLHPTHP